ncbi:Glyoxalase-like domain protein [Pseudovibrio sp. W64]|uniref:VOC family protein n=1 Tax=unclassified Pseudovibrio TaxID=2627060 RepID=UPI0007AE6245|nr:MULTISPECIES: VOC family protein [unclassified Pseudovibrio]KZK78688.1 Glyoxalase-like domain protein [Pseudovibrio sp. W64]
MGNQDKSINYIEFPLLKNEETKSFYSSVFGWVFEDWGPSYISFSGAGVEGGFNGESGTAVQAPGVLVVLYAADLEGTIKAVRAAGAAILQDIYSFPGGQRFHFADPNGNELAVWTEASS